MAPIQARMPVILAPASYRAWLSGATPPQTLLVPCAPVEIVARRVSRAVNSASLDGPSLVAPEAAM